MIDNIALSMGLVVALIGIVPWFCERWHRAEGYRAHQRALRRIGGEGGRHVAR